MMLNLQEDIEAMFGSLSGCWDSNHVDENLGVERIGKFSDPHPAADRYIGASEEGREAIRAELAKRKPVHFVWQPGGRWLARLTESEYRKRNREKIRVAAAHRREKARAA